jgi:hypothetical protein
MCNTYEDEETELVIIHKDNIQAIVMLQNNILGFETLQAFVILQINFLIKASVRMINGMKVKRYSANCQYVAVKTSAATNLARFGLKFEASLDRTL